MRPDTRESIVQIFKRGSAHGEEPRERENRRRLTSEHVSPSDRYFLSSLVAKNTPDCFYNFFFAPSCGISSSSAFLSSVFRNMQIYASRGARKTPHGRCRLIVETGKTKRSSVFGGVCARVFIKPGRWNVEGDVGWVRNRSSAARRVLGVTSEIRCILLICTFLYFEYLERSMFISIRTEYRKRGKREKQIKEQRKRDLNHTNNNNNKNTYQQSCTKKPPCDTADSSK